MKMIEQESMVKRMRDVQNQLNEGFEGAKCQQEKTYIKRELEKLKRKREETKTGYNLAKK